jgi:membrane glycosyltransferase
MMAFHVVFVVSTFLGFRVSWDAQERHERGQQFRAALAAHWKQTAVGFAAGAFVWSLAPGILPWLSPVLCGLILAVPLSVLLSSVPVGQGLASRGLLITPEETAPPRVLRRLRRLLARSKEIGEPRTMFRRVLTDPAFAELHCCVLRATHADRPADPEQVDRVEKRLRSGAFHRVSADDRKAVLSDPEAVRSLQLAAWSGG